MSERVSPGAAGKRPGVSGADIRRAGYARVAAARLDAREREPPAWPGLVKGCTRLAGGRRGKEGRRPEVPSRAGTVLPRTSGVAGFPGGRTGRVAAAAERAGVAWSSALAQAAFPGGRGGPGCHG
jgi:hypothetical protein